MILSSWMLISPNNTASQNLSLQISEIPIGSEQPIHNHEPEQCYYIIKGKGLMVIENESQEVKAGDAIFIPSNLKHGIKNLGKDWMSTSRQMRPRSAKNMKLPCGQ